MNVKPIIFSAPMVRALLDGRKTQTRRILKQQPKHLVHENGEPLPIGCLHVMGEPRPRITVGRFITRHEIPVAIGDALWVRESWADVLGIIYKADYPENDPAYRPQKGWRPSIHMPRVASRLTLVVTDVRVERLQDISEEDAQAEGVVPDPNAVRKWGYPQEAKFAFADLWEGINGPGSWEANPWVAAYTFTVHRQNVDAYLATSAAA